MNKSKIVDFSIGAAGGAILFILLYGTKVLDIQYTDWLMNSGDLTQHYLGWEFFRDAEWTFPIGMMENLGYPFGVAVTYMDAIPLMAIVFKCLDFLLPERFQYFGLWGIICFMLQGGLAVLILKEFISNRWYTYVAAIFFIYSPALIIKMYGHTALASHWILLLTILCTIHFCKKNTPINRVCLIYSVISIIAVLIHPYFVPMVLAIVLWFCIDNYFCNKQASVVVKLLSSTIGSTMIIFYLIGGFTGESYATGGLGFYSLNLNALINSQGWSRYLLALPLATGGQYEGFQYLGLGIIILSIIVVGYFIFNFNESDNLKNIITKRKISLAIITGILLIVSLSPKITLGNKIIFEYPVPKIIESIWAIFQSSGRFLWPVYYALMALLLVYGYHLCKNKKISTVLIIFLVLVQIFDISQVLSEKRTYFTSERVYDTPLKSSFWTDAAQIYNNIIVLPPKNDNYQHFSDLAIDNEMTLNTGYISRAPWSNINNYAYEEIKKLMQGKIDNNLYIIEDIGVLNEIISKGFKDITIAKVDNFFVAVPSKDWQMNQYEDVEIIIDKQEMKFDSNTMKKNENVYIYNGKYNVNPGGIVYGPYTYLDAGNYVITIKGENLINADYDLIYNQGKAKVEIETIGVSNKEIKYKVQIQEPIWDAEYRLINSTENIMVFDYLACEEEEKTSGYIIDFADGFYEKECNSQGQSWRWAGQNAQINIKFNGDNQQKARIKIYLSTGYKELANMKVAINGKEENIKVNNQGISFEREFILDSENSIQIFTDAEQVYAPLDERELYFRIDDFDITFIN